MWAECINNINAVLTISLPYEYTGSNLLGFSSNSVGLANTVTKSPVGEMVLFSLELWKQGCLLFYAASSQTREQTHCRGSATETTTDPCFLGHSQVHPSLASSDSPGPPAQGLMLPCGLGSPALNNNQDNPSQTRPRPIWSGQSLNWDSLLRWRWAVSSWLLKMTRKMRSGKIGHVQWGVATDSNTVPERVCV